MTEMQERDIFNLGMGGVIVVLVLREMFRYLRSRPSGNGKSNATQIRLAGSESTDYWQNKFTEIMATATRPCMQMHADSIKALAESQQRVQEHLMILVSETKTQTKMLERLLDRRE